MPVNAPGMWELTCRLGPRAHPSKDLEGGASQCQMFCKKPLLRISFTPHFFLIPISFMAGLVAVHVGSPAAAVSVCAAHEDGLLKDLSKDARS